MRECFAVINIVHYLTLLNATGPAATIVGTIIIAAPVVKGGCARVRKKLANPQLARCWRRMVRRRYHGRHARQGRLGG